MDDIHRRFLAPIADMESRGGDCVAFRLRTLDSLLDGDRLLELPMFEAVHIGELRGDEVSRGSSIDETASFHAVDANSSDERFFEPGKGFFAGRRISSPIRNILHLAGLTQFPFVNGPRR